MRHADGKCTVSYGYAYQGGAFVLDDQNPAAGLQPYQKRVIDQFYGTQPAHGLYIHNGRKVDHGTVPLITF